MSISNESSEALRAQLLQRDQTIALQAQTIALLTQMLSGIDDADAPEGAAPAYLNPRSNG